MRTTPPLRFALARTRSAGAALVITLAFLVLILVLVVTLLLQGRGSVSVTDSYATGITLQTLADSTRQLATSQITQATMDAAKGSSGEVTAIDPARRYTWISQPGLIRTYRGTGSGPVAVRSYKLYSDEEMIREGDWDPEKEVGNEIPANWAAQPLQFTDLNEPVRDSTGALAYPVLPAAPTLNAITGFSLQSSHPENGGGDGVAMPVRWLYTLRDGRFAAMDASGNVPNASENNPIVGRVAFWTDDETSKLNINTASEGTHWDMPFSNAPSEYDFARYQPAQGEYQRYPGHPATVSLGPVLQAFGVTTPQAISALTPRVVDAQADSGRGTRRSTAISPLDSDRLYASLDELAFKPGRDGTGLSAAQVNQLRFFLTTQSRAPELNAFQQPRVTIWPGNTGSTSDASPPGSSASPYNRLIAFCSNVGGRRFDFVRTRGSQVNERFQEVRRTNLNMTRFSRNRALYAYLQRLTSVPPAGSAGPGESFEQKYTAAERDQILTQIYDYIRGMTNLNQYGTGQTATSEHYTETHSGNKFGSGQVMPTRLATIAAPAPTPTTGAGRMPVITELALCFTSVGVTDPPTEPHYELTLLPEIFIPSAGYIALNYNHLIQISGLRNLLVDGVPVYPNDTIRGRLQGKLNEGNDYTMLGSFVGPASWRWNYRNMSPTGGGYNSNLNSSKFLLPTGTINFSQSGPITIEIRTFTAANPGDFNAWDPNELIQTYRVTFPNGPTPIGWPAPKGNGAFSRRTRLGQESNSIKAHGVGEFIRNNDGGITDTVRSVEIKPDSPFADYRLIAMSLNVPETEFAPINQASYDSTTSHFSHSLRGGSIDDLVDGFMFLGRGPHRGATMTGSLVEGMSHNAFAVPAAPARLDGAFMSNGAPGDWDSGLANMPDGAYLNKPDEGNEEASTGSGNSKAWVPYFATSFIADSVGVTFSPNRHLPSAVMFGSLPTGARRLLPWQTLLFSPNSAAAISGAAHPGSVDPPDHLLLDLFQMPVVDPYAISEPFSTAGRVNLNSQIAPFTYVSRQTALHGVLAPLRLSAVSDADAAVYKGPRRGSNAVNFSNLKVRYNVDVEKTLEQWEDRFSANRPFLTSSEVCSLFLHPEGHLGSPESFWLDKRLTGDNLRERPYVELYPKVTTQSNSYSVHVRVQSLRKVRGTPHTNFVEGRDVVAGQWRGSYQVERYIDPDDPRFGVDASGQAPAVIDPDYEALTPAYQWRTILTKRFQP